MPNLHDIERRIKSVTSTKQITRTMEMVAAAKIRRASERVESALPWAVAISDMLISTAKYAHLDNEPLLQVHDEVKRVLIVAVTSDRGLAGGFNTNVLRYVEKLSKEKQREGAEVEVAACGKKAIGYFTYRGIEPVFSFAGYSADPEFAQAAELSGYVMQAYAEGKLDEVFIVYNHAKNAAEQTLVEQQVLPQCGLPQVGVDVLCFAVGSPGPRDDDKVVSGLELRLQHHQRFADDALGPVALDGTADALAGCDPDPVRLLPVFH